MEANIARVGFQCSIGGSRANQHPVCIIRYFQFIDFPLNLQVGLPCPVFFVGLQCRGKGSEDGGMLLFQRLDGGGGCLERQAFHHAASKDRLSDRVL